MSGPLFGANCVCTDERCTRPEHTPGSRITDQMVERAVEAYRATFEYGDPRVGIRAALAAALGARDE